MGGFCIINNISKENTISSVALLMVVENIF